MSEFIKGKCLLMCPEKERWMREKERLLHMFEIDEKTKGLKYPKADPKKIVKCYGRPAAGQDMTDPNQLRPASVLMLTVKYLLSEIVTRTDVDWLIIYDFVFDRLRAVRQDIAIQRLSISSTISIFEPIIRFLVYSAQRLCEKKTSEYDPAINNQHLSECLKHVLVLYEELEKERESNDLDQIMDNLRLKDNRPEMEALYILVYIGDVKALERALKLPHFLRQSWLLQRAFQISLAWHLKNYVKVFRLIEKLPPLLLCAVLTNLNTLRRSTLKIMSSAYNSKVLTYPGTKLQEMLLYKDFTKLQLDCEHYGLKIIDENIQFQKANFVETTKLANYEKYYTEEALINFLPCILLEAI